MIKSIAIAFEVIPNPLNRYTEKRFYPTERESSHKHNFFESSRE